MANSPERLTTMVLSGPSPYEPFSAETLKELDVATAFENSDKRSFYSTKPTKEARPVLNYHVEAPGRTKACVLQIGATPSYSLTEIKAIAASLSAAK